MCTISEQVQQQEATGASDAFRLTSLIHMMLAGTTISALPHCKQEGYLQHTTLKRCLPY